MDPLSIPIGLITQARTKQFNKLLASWLMIFGVEMTLDQILKNLENLNAIFGMEMTLDQILKNIGNFGAI